PLLPQRTPRTPRVREGVFHYLVGDDDADLGASGDWSAEALAEWIASRIRSGERLPEDFLVLTLAKHTLEAYARALESRGLAVDVAGAGIGIEEELAELTLLLRALADPDDPVKVIGVLVGLFFGLDHAALLAHRKRGASFDVRQARAGTGDPVEE